MISLKKTQESKGFDAQIIYRLSLCSLSQTLRMQVIGFSDDNSIHMLSPAGDLLADFDGTQNGPNLSDLRSVASADSGEILVCAGGGPGVRVFTLEHGVEELSPLIPWEDSVLAVATNAGGRLVILREDGIRVYSASA